MHVCVFLRPTRRPAHALPPPRLAPLFHVLSLPVYRCTAVYRRGLLYCMEYLEDNLEEWLGDELEVRLGPGGEGAAGRVLSLWRIVHGECTTHQLPCS